MSKPLNLPPFYIGQKVISIVSWRKLRKLYGFNYPKKGQVVVVSGVVKNSGGEWHIFIPKCQIKLWAKNFAPVKEIFEPIEYREVVKREQPITCKN